MSRTMRFPTLRDEVTLRTMAATMTDEQIAAIIGCAPKSVKNARLEYRIPKFGHDMLTQCTFAGDRSPILDDPRQLRKLVARMSDPEVAAHLGCSRGMVADARRRFGMMKRVHVDSEYAGVIPTMDTRPVTVVCPTCRWTSSTMASVIRGQWQLDFDSKLRQEGRTVYHVPCGSRMRVFLLTDTSQRQAVAR